MALFLDCTSFNLGVWIKLNFRNGWKYIGRTFHKLEIDVGSHHQ